MHRRRLFQALPAVACAPQAFALTPTSPKYNDDLQKSDKKSTAGGPPILIPSGGDTINCPVDIYGTNLPDCTSVTVIIQDSNSNVIGSSIFTATDGFWGGEIGCHSDVAFPSKGVSVTAFCSDNPSKANSITGMTLEGDGVIVIDDIIVLTNLGKKPIRKAKKRGAHFAIEGIKYKKLENNTTVSTMAYNLTDNVGVKTTPKKQDTSDKFDIVIETSDIKKLILIEIEFATKSYTAPGRFRTIRHSRTILVSTHV